MAQDPVDEPATALLERVEAAQRVLATEAKSRQRTDLAATNEDEQPFKTPDGWCWVRFGLVTNVVGGVTLGENSMDGNSFHFRIFVSPM